MMSSTLGAPFGGTIRGGHHGVESLALSLITPPNFGGGGGSCFPSMVVVALGEPNWPVTCCAAAGMIANMATSKNAAASATAAPLKERATRDTDCTSPNSLRRVIIGPPSADEFEIVCGDPQGIMPHSIILLTTGAATMLTNEARIFGSLRNICMASCSCWDGGFFCDFCCHNCSQLELWYFCATFVAMASTTGYCALAMLT